MKKIKFNEDGFIRLLIVFNIILFIYSYNINVWRFEGSQEFHGSYIPNFILSCTSIIFNFIEDHFTRSIINTKMVWSFSLCVVVDVLFFCTYFLIKWVSEGFKKDLNV